MNKNSCRDQTEMFRVTHVYRPTLTTHWHTVGL